MSKKTLTYIFWGVVLLIVIAVVVYFFRKPADGEAGGEGNGDSNVITTLTGQRCTGITNDMAMNLQVNLNEAGCRDLKGNLLKVDGTIGPKTFQALQGCIAKKIIG